MRSRLLTVLLTILLVSCASEAPRISTNRPDGEGHAGRGEVVLRVQLYDSSPTGLIDRLRDRRERATIEILYQGIDDEGRIVFERRDIDHAGTPAGAQPAETSRRLTVDLRSSRLLRVQGKVIEVRDADSSGVDFQLY